MGVSNSSAFGWQPSCARNNTEALLQSLMTGDPPACRIDLTQTQVPSPSRSRADSPRPFVSDEPNGSHLSQMTWTRHTKHTRLVLSRSPPLAGKGPDMDWSRDSLNIVVSFDKLKQLPNKTPARENNCSMKVPPAGSWLPSSRPESTVPQHPAPDTVRLHRPRATHPMSSHRPRHLPRILDDIS